MTKSAANKNDAEKSKTIKDPRVFYLPVIVIGVAAVLFGFLRILNTIKSPFLIDSIVENTTKIAVDDEVAEFTRLRNQDTDNDGLNDYDETYVYGTSAYLADSDSDGYDDKLEIETGNNPMCPAGQNCLAGSEDFGTDTESQIAIPALKDPIQLSSDELRQMLVDSGVDATTLSQVDDNTLMQMYKQSLSEIQIQQGQGGAVNTGNADKNDLERLQNLSPDQVRDLLIQAGIDKAEIDKLSDEELMKIYQETLAEQEK